MHWAGRRHLSIFLTLLHLRLLLFSELQDSTERTSEWPPPSADLQPSYLDGIFPIIPLAVSVTESYCG